MLSESASYCNHCGAKTGAVQSKGAAQAAEPFTESIVWAIVTVFIVGFGCIIGLMAMMKELLKVSNSWILGFALLGFLLTCVTEGVLISLVWRGKRGAQKAVGAGTLDGRATRELDEAPLRSLAEPVASVTEQPTRVFEPSRRK